MKKIKIILIISLIICGINLYSQNKNFNGYYTNPQINDRLINTAITDFVSGKMLIIDTYEDNITNKYYLLFRFVDNSLNQILPFQVIRYDETQVKHISINDVKYDATNNCYIACGWEDILDSNKRAIYKTAGIIMKIDILGNIVWRNDQWDNINCFYAANEFRRVEIFNNETGNFYAACGWGYELNSNTRFHGNVTFFNTFGDSFYASNHDVTHTNNNSKYMDLLCNTNNNKIAIVGTYYDISNVPIGILEEEIEYIGFSINISLPINIRTVEREYEWEATSICKDNSGNYFIAGRYKNNIEENLYTAKIDANSRSFIIENYYPIPNNHDKLEVNDMCYNPYFNPKNTNIGNLGQLGIVGVCHPYPYPGKTILSDQGFLCEINEDLTLIPNGFSTWSGYNSNIQPAIFKKSYFNHIVYRNNNYNNMNYSYIMYGKSEKANVSYIAEYYHLLYFDNCFEKFEDYSTHSISPILLVNQYEEPELFENFREDLIKALQFDSMGIICDQVYYEDPPILNKNLIKIETNTILDYSYEAGFLKLNDSYKQAICNVYTIEGKLVYTKQSGVLTIPTSTLKPGIYFLQPINETRLKPFKFNVIH